MTNQPFFFRKDGLLKKIALAEILFIEAADNYAKFYARDYHHVIRTSLDAALRQLPANEFQKIHRSYAVSVNHLEEIAKDFVLVGNIMLPVSKKYYQEFIARIKIIDASLDTTP